MLLVINVYLEAIRYNILLKYEVTVYGLDLGIKVKFDITNVSSDVNS